VPNPTVVSDLEDRFRPLTDAEKTVANALLIDAWVELLARIPDLEDRMVAGRVSDALVRRVVAAMAVRVLKNPDAIRQWQIDDASFTRDQLVSSGMLYASPDELGLLLGTPAMPPPPLSFSASYGGRW
jgi:hypothetical protein